VNKKVARLAFRRALSEKVVAGEIRILEELSMPEAKTKIFAGLMKSLAVKAPALFVMDKMDEKVVRAARNIPGIELTAAGSVNVYQLVRYPVLVADRAGMDKLKARLKVGKEKDE